VFYVNQEIGGYLMKKSYLEPEIEIVKFSFSDSVLKIIPSDNSDPTEDNVGEDVNDND
jgi:hypothetical protein